MKKTTLSDRYRDIGSSMDVSDFFFFQSACDGIE